MVSSIARGTRMKKYDQQWRGGRGGCKPNFFSIVQPCWIKEHWDSLRLKSLWDSQHWDSKLNEAYRTLN